MDDDIDARDGVDNAIAVDDVEDTTLSVTIAFTSLPVGGSTDNGVGSKVEGGILPELRRRPTAVFSAFRCRGFVALSSSFNTRCAMLVASTKEHFGIRGIVISPDTEEVSVGEDAPVINRP